MPHGYMYALKNILSSSWLQKQLLLPKLRYLHVLCINENKCSIESGVQINISKEKTYICHSLRSRFNLLWTRGFQYGIFKKIVTVCVRVWEFSIFTQINQTLFSLYYLHQLIQIQATTIQKILSHKFQKNVS